MNNKNKTTDLNVSDASGLLGVSTRSVINYIKGKEIEAVKVGKSWYINKASLDAFILKYNFGTKSIEPLPSAKAEQKEGASSQKKYSVKDLRLFIKINEVLPPDCFESVKVKETTLSRLLKLRFTAIEYVGAGYYSFGAANKMHHYEKSREKVAGIIAILYGENSKDSKIQELLNKIEEDLLPVYSSLIKRMDKKIERPKNL